MSFLRRLLGGGGEAGEPAGAGSRPGSDDADATDPVADEQARERELLLDEARRLDDDFIQRQMRYADRSWTPPAQGGSRRADDEDAADE
jgi:hypothetical protein